MLVACLVVAGALRATLPATEFTLAWSHSVEHSRWVEHYAVEGDRIRLVSAHVEGSGAGMEAGDGARFDGDGWTWDAKAAPMASVALTLSPYTSDYTLCAGGRCAGLYEWTHERRGDTAVVVVRPCPG
ncbi:MAG TPA: DUF1850 domain-containing protein [Casimicrobiaceae bacterium]|nr:DUF1850 domain-containing protein [Casimicrobiaceae bacterium]